jgi:hypothetical protein
MSVCPGLLRFLGSSPFQRVVNIFTATWQPLDHRCAHFIMGNCETQVGRGVEASFSKTTGNKTLELGGVSPSNDLIRYKMESFYFYLI